MASLQATTTLTGIGLAVLILFPVRRDRLCVMHGLFWVCLAVFVAWPGLIDHMARWTGIGDSPALMPLLACMVLPVKALRTDMVNSRIERDVRCLNWRLALPEANADASRSRTTTISLAGGVATSP